MAVAQGIRRVAGEESFGVFNLIGPTERKNAGLGDLFFKENRFRAHHITPTPANNKKQKEREIYFVLREWL